MSDTEKEKAKAFSLKLGEGAAFMGAKLYLVAAGVFLIGVLFECLSSSAFHADDFLKTLQQVEIGSTLNQASTFLNWRAANLLLLGCALMALVLAGLNIFMAYRHNRLATFVLGSMALVVGSITAMVFASLEEPTSFLKALTTYVSVRDLGLLDRNLVPLLILPKRIAETCAGCVGFAMAAVMILPSTIDIADIRDRLQRLRILLYSSATMLVIGVFSVRSSYAFVLSFVTTKDGGSGIESVIDGGVGMAAAFYTLVLAGGYLPAALVLGSFARRLAAQAEAEGHCDSEAEFLEKNSLNITRASQVGRLFAMAAPLLTAAIPGASYIMLKT